MTDVEKFLKFYSSVSTLHPDDCIDPIDTDPSSLTEEIYLNKIYVEREDYKQAIKAEIYQNPRKQICIIGPQGSGKSTIGMKIRSELIKTGDYIVLFVDARHKHWSSPSNNGKSLRERYQEMLLDEVIQFFQREVFPARPDQPDDNPEWRFFAFLFDRALHPKEFHFDQKIINKAINMKALARRFDDSYYNWVKEYFSKQEGIEFKEDVEASIRPEHYTLAHTYISSLRERERGGVTQKFVFWIDNLDRLPEDDQMALMSAIEELKNQLRTPLFVVAVREENVFNYDNVLDAGAVHRVMVYWRDPSQYENAVETGALQMPVVDEEFFNLIIGQRLSYTKDVLQRKKKYLADKIRETRQKMISKTNDPHLRSQLQSFEEQYSLVNITFNGPFFSLLNELMQRVTKVMFEERMEFIANNSIRILIPMHYQFFDYLIQRNNYRNERPEFLDFPDWFIQTELLAWLTGHEVFRLYDIVRHTVEHKTSRVEPISSVGCYLPHLTLTCIWNLTIKKRLAKPDRNSMPTVQEVITTLEQLKYSEEDIKQTLVDLVTSSNERCNLITIPSPHPVREVRHLENIYSVRLTYRGRTFLNRVACSFGYIYACVKNIRPFQNSKASPVDTTQYGREALPLLKIVGQSHLLSLVKIRTDCYNNEPNWFIHYLATFGVPLDRSLTRSDTQFQIGERISDDSQYRHALYFETLVGSMRAYFHRSNHQMPVLDKLDLDFRGYRNRIIKGETLTADDIIF